MLTTLARCWKNMYLLCLFLEGIQDAVNKLFFQTGINIRWAKVSHGLQRQTITVNGTLNKGKNTNNILTYYKPTFSIVSMTIFLYCSFSSFRSSTILLIISDAPTLFANSTVVSTSCQIHKINLTPPPNYQVKNKEDRGINQLKGQNFNHQNELN